MDTPTTVYCVFESEIDGDGYLGWKLLFVSFSLDRAKELIAEAGGRLKWNPIHPSMNRENLYTYVGTREECRQGYNMEAQSFVDESKGYVIEAQTPK